MPVETQADILASLHERLTDMEDRLTHLEQTHLEFLQRVSDTEKLTLALTDKVTTVEADRNDYRARVDTVEKLPNTNAETVAALERRVRALEGAVGTAAKQARDPQRAQAMAQATPQPAEDSSNKSKTNRTT